MEEWRTGFADIVYSKVVARQFQACSIINTRQKGFSKREWQTIQQFGCFDTQGSFLIQQDRNLSLCLLYQDFNITPHLIQKLFFWL